MRDGNEWIEGGIPGFCEWSMGLLGLACCKGSIFMCTESRKFGV